MGRSVFLEVSHSHIPRCVAQVVPKIYCMFIGLWFIRLHTRAALYIQFICCFVLGFVKADNLLMVTGA